MMRRIWKRLLRAIKWWIPLGLYVWLYKRKDPDKYDFIWKDGDYRVIIYDRKIYGVWYQPKRLNPRKRSK